MPSIGNEFAKHDVVDHSRKEYGYTDRETGAKINTNTVEGYYSIFKRGMKGVYQHCGEKHLHRYLAEFDFRYSNRTRLGIEDAERVAKIVEGAKGKRLQYRRPNESPLRENPRKAKTIQRWGAGVFGAKGPSAKKTQAADAAARRRSSGVTQDGRRHRAGAGVCGIGFHRLGWVR